MKVQFRLSTLLLLLTIGLLSLGAVTDHVRQVQRYETLRQENVETFLGRKLREELRRSQTAQSSQEFMDSCHDTLIIVGLLRDCGPLSTSTMSSLVDVETLQRFKGCDECDESQSVVKMGAALTLTSLGRDAIPFLMDLLKDQDADRRRLAAEVLSHIVFTKEPGRLISRKEVLELIAPIQAAMDAEESPNVRVHLENVILYAKRDLKEEDE